MSTTNTKAKKSVSKAKAEVTAVEIESVLAQTSIEYVPFKQLALTELNARKRPPAPAGIIKLACSIAAVGLLQNLIVYRVNENELGVAGGGRRFLALDLLNKRDSSGYYRSSQLIAQLKEAGLENKHVIVTDDYPVPVKIVSKEMAYAISMIENDQREAMHITDQLDGFIKLSETGHTPSAIAELMGYSTKHVQRCLRVATMAPKLLELLSENRITLDQMQALASTEDHQRQVDVWENSYYSRTPDELRRKVQSGEIKAEESGQLKYIGRESYEMAGGTFRYDLFTDEGFICDAPLLERLAREKLANTAKAIATTEGWAWSEGRINEIRSYGEDSSMYRIINAPEPVYSQEQLARKDYLDKTVTSYEEQLCENEHDEEETGEVLTVRNEYLDELDQLKVVAIANAWSDEIKASAGVVVSLDRGELSIQRGIELKTNESDKDEQAKNETTDIAQSSPEDEAERASKLSEKLVISLSSERTLAVQAALAQRTDIALPFIAYALITSVYGRNNCNLTPLQISLQPSYSYLKKNAPTIGDSRADKELSAMHEAWLARFPENWNAGFDWLLTWSQDDLIAIISYCGAISLNGSGSWLADGQAGHKLLPVEKALAFNMRDYWQPTKDNFFGRIKKPNIENCLVEAGLEVHAIRVSTMKKGEAAEVAEKEMANTRWIPACLHKSESTENANEIIDVSGLESSEEQDA